MHPTECVALACPSLLCLFERRRRVGGKMRTMCSMAMCPPLLPQFSDSDPAAFIAISIYAAWNRNTATNSRCTMTHWCPPAFGYWLSLYHLIGVLSILIMIMMVGKWYWSPVNSLLIGGLVIVRVRENSKTINMMIVVIDQQLHTSWLSFIYFV